MHNYNALKFLKNNSLEDKMIGKERTSIYSQLLWFECLPQIPTLVAKLLRGRTSGND